MPHNLSGHDFLQELLNFGIWEREGLISMNALLNSSLFSSAIGDCTTSIIPAISLANRIS